MSRGKQKRRNNSSEFGAGIRTIPIGWWRLAAAAVPFLLYLNTVAPTVYGLDSAELTTGAYHLGIVHAPGSPLFLLIGHLFTWLPFGDVGYRVNLLSVVATVGMIVFSFELMRLLVQDRLLALLSAWLLSITYYVWIAAVAAELYSLQGFFVSLLLWLLLRWNANPGPRLLMLIALLFGLGVGAHTSLVLLLPGFLILIFAKLNLSQWRVIGGTIAAGLLGAAVYLYLPFRYAANPPLNYAQIWGVDLTTVDGFLWMLSGQMFGSLFFGTPLRQLPAEVGSYLFQLWSNFFGLGLLVGILGLWHGWQRAWRIHRALLLMFVLHAFFFVTYAVLDKELMFLPTFIIFGAWFCVGAQWLAQTWIGEQFVLLVLLFLFLGGGILNYGFADLSDDVSARILGEAIFETLEADAIFIGTWQDVPILEYLQLVEGQRQDVSLHNTFFLRDTGEKVDAWLEADRPIYTTIGRFDTQTPISLIRVAACQCYLLQSNP